MAAGFVWQRKMIYFPDREKPTKTRSTRRGSDSGQHKTREKTRFNTRIIDGSVVTGSTEKWWREFIQFALSAERE